MKTKIEVKVSLEEIETIVRRELSLPPSAALDWGYVSPKEGLSFEMAVDGPLGAIPQAQALRRRRILSEGLSEVEANESPGLSD